MTDDAIRVPTGLTTEGLLGRRYMARCIDGVILFVLLALTAAIVGLVLGKIASAGASAAASFTSGAGVLISLCLGWCVWMAYGSLLEASEGQATLGKKFMRLKVYNATGGRLSVGQAVARNVVKDGPFLFLAMIGVAAGSNLLTLLWLGAHMLVMHRSPVYQAIHDRVAHTWVAAPEEMTQLRLS